MFAEVLVGSEGRAEMLKVNPCANPGEPTNLNHHRPISHHRSRSIEPNPA